MFIFIHLLFSIFSKYSLYHEDSLLNNFSEQKVQWMWISTHAFPVKYNDDSMFVNYQNIYYDIKKLTQ